MCSWVNLIDIFHKVW